MKKYLVFITSALMFTVFAAVFLHTSAPAEALSQERQKMVDEKADDVINTAIDLIGKATYNNNLYKNTYPYEFGCGGFVKFVFLQNGIDLCTRNNNHMVELGTYVPKSELARGDLVFFNSRPGGVNPTTHVAIYIGDNKVIHMADSKNHVIVSDLSGQYYTTYYTTARRVIPGFLPPEIRTRADELVEFAENLIGKVKYGYPNNESTLTFTSHGLTHYVFKEFDVDLQSMNASQQAELGQFVPKEEIQKGDLIFFSTEANPDRISLVGIYAGNLQVVICASPTTNANKILLAYDFYKKHYMTARRINLEPNNGTPKGENICMTANSLIGKAKFGSPYNEQTLTFNSSEFAYYVYKQNGIDLGKKSALELLKMGRFVAQEDLQKGDLIFFSLAPGTGTISQHSLVGIYCGNDEFIVSASSGTGVVSRKLSTNYYQTRYVTARHLL